MARLWILGRPGIWACTPEGISRELYARQLWADLSFSVRLQLVTRSPLGRADTTAKKCTPPRLLFLVKREMVGLTKR